MPDTETEPSSAPRGSTTAPALAEHALLTAWPWRQDLAGIVVAGIVRREPPNEAARRRVEDRDPDRSERRACGGARDPPADAAHGGGQANVDPRRVGVRATGTWVAVAALRAEV